MTGRHCRNRSAAAGGETAIALSILAHAVLFFALWERNNYDLERAAGAAAASNDGTIVIPIEVLVSAALPSAQKPVEATTPDEKQVTNTPPQAQQENKKQEKTDTAPPQKNDEAPEVVQTAKESPKPEKEKQDQKKKETSAASQTAAANPSQAAASRAQGRAGAGGRLESGGTANSSAYQAQVLAHLQRFRSYPPRRKPPVSAVPATVRFSLSSSGGVISASLAHGSGASVLDQAARSRWCGEPRPSRRSRRISAARGWISRRRFASICAETSLGATPRAAVLS